MVSILLAVLLLFPNLSYGMGSGSSLSVEVKSESEVVVDSEEAIEVAGNSEKTEQEESTKESVSKPTVEVEETDEVPAEAPEQKQDVEGSDSTKATNEEQEEVAPVKESEETVEEDAVASTSEIPELTAVDVVTETASPGESVRVNFSFTNPEFISLGEVGFVSPSGIYDWAELYYDETTGQFATDFYVSGSMEPGVWTIGEIWVTSDYDQWHEITSELTSSVSFTIVNDNPDYTAPVLETIEVVTPEVAVGEEVVIAAQVSDDSSGVSYVEAEFYNENGDSRYIDFQYDSATDQWIGSYVVESNHPPGTWTLGYVWISDHAGNPNWYDEYEFPNVSYIVVNPDGDFTAPVLGNIEVVTPEVAVGEEVIITADVSDDLSGVSYVEAEFTNENGDYRFIDFQYDSEKNKWVGSYVVESNHQPGTWTLSYVWISDEAGNTNWYYESDLPSASYSVVNPDGDFTAPVLENIQVVTREVTVGQEVIIKAEASDDLSGVYHVEAEFSDVNGNYKWINFNYDSETNSWIGSYVVESNHQPGTWSLSYVSLSDEAGNYYSYSRDELPSISYVVSNPDGDFTPPVLENVEVVTPEVTVGEEVIITAQVSDNLSGASYLQAEFSNGSGNSKWVDFQYDSETNQWVGSYVVGANHLPGTWTLTYVALTDEAGNHISYSGEELPVISYEVVNPDGDFNGPVLENIELTTPEAAVGEKVVFTAQVSDDSSGVSEVIAEINHENGEYNTISFEYDASADQWVGSYVVEKNHRPGTWTLSYLWLYDVAGNYQSYSQEELPSLSYTVVNPDGDFTAPVLDHIEVVTSEVAVGEEVIITAQATDEQSGVSYLEAEFYHENGDYNWISFDYDSESNVWVGSYVVEANHRPGTWTLSYVSVSDEAGNYSWYDQEELPSLSYTVVNPDGDFTAPVLENIEVVTSEVAVGEEVIITAQATDEQSGVSYLEAEFYNENDDYQTVWFEYDSETNQWVGSYIVESNHRPGTWTLSYVWVTDHAGNTVWYGQEELPSVSYTVVNPDGDFTEPVIESVNIITPEVSVGEEIIIEAKVTDTQSAVTFVVAGFAIEYNGDYFWNYIEFEYDESRDVWVGTHIVRENDVHGTWLLESIHAEDAAGNYSFQYVADPSATVIVNNPDGDFLSPTLEHIGVNVTEAVVGDVVTISADVTDKTGVEMVEVTFRGQNSDDYKYYYLQYNDTTGKWEYSYTVGEFDRQEEWILTDVWLADVLGNTGYLYEEQLPNVSYSVVNTNEDTIAATIESFVIKTPNVQVGDEVVIEAVVVDDKSGVQEVFAGFMNLNEAGDMIDYRTIPFVYDESTGIWKGSYTVLPIHYNGTYTLDHIGFVDYAGNWKYMMGDEVAKTFGGVTYVVDNPNVVDPTVTSAEVTPNSATYGEEVTVKLGVENGAGLDRIGAVFTHSTSDEFFEVVLEFDEALGMFVGTDHVPNYLPKGTWNLHFVYVFNHDFFRELIITDGVSASFTLEAKGDVITSPYFDEAAYYESVGSYYNAVYYAGKALEAGDTRAEELMLRVAELLFAEAEKTNDLNAFELLVSTYGVPIDIQEAAAGKLNPITSASYDEAVWYESAGSYYNAVYYAGKALEDGDTRAEELMARVAELLFNEAEIKDDFNAFELLATTYGVPADIQQAAANKLNPITSASYDEAVWYESVGSYYNAVYFAGKALEDGDTRATELMARVAQLLFAEAEKTNDLNAFELLVNTYGVPIDIQEAAAGKLGIGVVASPNYDEAAWYESVGSYYNAVYFAGKAIEDGDTRATDLMARVAKLLYAEAEVKSDQNAFELLASTNGVPADIQQAAQAQLGIGVVTSPSYGEAVWYESEGSYYNAVYFAGQALKDGDTRATILMARVAELLFAEAELKNDLNAFELLANTYGVPSEIQQAAASKLGAGDITSPSFAEAVWYESVGNYYNAVYFAGKAIEEGDSQAQELMNRVAEALYQEANENYANGNITEAENAYALLLATTGVPTAIKEAINNK